MSNICILLHTTRIGELPKILAKQQTFHGRTYLPPKKLHQKLNLPIWLNTDMIKGSVALGRDTYKITFKDGTIFKGPVNSMLVFRLDEMQTNIAQALTKNVFEKPSWKILWS